MKRKILCTFIFVLGALAVFTLPGRADGIIIPEPPFCEGRTCPPPPCPGPHPCPIPPPTAQLAIRYHHVSVVIQDQVAVTHVDQIFFNPNDWQVEGTYMFPIPIDAALTSFTLWVDGQPVEARILDADQARQEYEQIVRSLQDPALLEYIDRGAVQARIFPIPPGGERRIELEYTQALPADHGLVRYVYPLNTEKFSVYPLESVAVSVEIRGGVPIRAVYSPSHTVSIDRISRNQVKVGFEGSNLLPDSDFAVYYSLGDEQAFHLLTYRDPFDAEDSDGFFLLLLAPPPDTSHSEALPKDIILVLDRSGSMEGEKFQQAQEALRYILRHLNPEDRFSIMAFSTGLESYAPELRSASQIEDALDWVDQLSAQGSTDVNRALLEAAAIADRERPTYLIFLTDGLPTEGVVDSKQIIDNFDASAPQGLRLFTFGVGYDVDTFLLDSLSQSHHGTSIYILPGEPLDEVVSTFYARISTPVLTDLRLDFGNVRVYDLYPDPLPDLFAGSQIILAGRYRQAGVTDVVLRGEMDGRTQTYRFPEQKFPSQTPAGDMQSAISRLWATRKIGHLLSQIRLHGPNQEIIDQVVRLSIRYGIVTPYTSYLVTEDKLLGATEQDRIARDQFEQMQSAPTDLAYGQEAVEKAAEQGALSAAEAPLLSELETKDQVRILGSRTFVHSEGGWVDTAFDPEQMETVKVAFLSDDYFTLARSRAELAAAFALGEHVIAILDGIAYEVVAQGSDVPSIDALPQTTSATKQPVSTATSPPTPTAPSEPPEDTQSPTGTGCLGALLPLVLLPLAGMAYYRRR